MPTLPSICERCGYPTASPEPDTYRSSMDKDRSSTQAVNAKLRSIRMAQGYSLNDVELKSKGAIKAVVLGSYERGSRSMSIARIIQISEFYGVPPFSLFLDKGEQLPASGQRVILDLRTINRRLNEASDEHNDRIYHLARFTKSLIRARQDWNGEVVSIRSIDLENIGLLIDLESNALISWLEENRFLLRKPVKS